MLAGAEAAGIIYSLILVGLSVFLRCVLLPPLQALTPSHTHSCMPSAIPPPPALAPGRAT